MNKRIKIVTGKVQTGKTTRLFTFTHSHDSVDGILAPIVNEKRKLFHLSSRTMKELEVDEPNNNTISIGKYHFIKESFTWANEKLIESFNSYPEWLIIDELGKLELKGEGLHKATSFILKNKSELEINVILVIRDYLFEEMLKYYNISNVEYEILEI